MPYRLPAAVTNRVYVLRGSGPHLHCDEYELFEKRPTTIIVSMRGHRHTIRQSHGTRFVYTWAEAVAALRIHAHKCMDEYEKAAAKLKADLGKPGFHAALIVTTPNTQNPAERNIEL